MKYNEKEMIEYSFKPADKEGRLVHKSPYKSSVYSSAKKERWFKLVGNMLFYFRLNQDGVVEKEEPNGVFVLENTSVEPEVNGVYNLAHAISVKWKDDPYNKHIFFANSQNSQSSWISAFLKASYSNLQAELLSLRIQLRNITGKDPLEHMKNSVKKLPYMKDPTVSRPVKYTASFSTSEWYLPTATTITNMNKTSVSSAPSTPALLPKIPPRNKSKKNHSTINVNKESNLRQESFISYVCNEDISDKTIRIKPPTHLLD